MNEVLRESIPGVGSHPFLSKAIMKRKIAILSLAGLLIACGGDSGGNGPADANVQGTWVLTFSTNNSCALSQIAVILTESPSGAPTGTHGSYVFDCAGTANDETGDPGAILGYQVSGNDFSLQFTNPPEPRRITGTVEGNTMSGSFLWQPGATAYGGTFTGVRQ
jgi:hypothetical protein